VGRENQALSLPRVSLDFNGTQPVNGRASFEVSGNDRPHSNPLKVKDGYKHETSHSLASYPADRHPTANAGETSHEEGIYLILKF
jgi:hypothetical protein